METFNSKVDEFTVSMFLEQYNSYGYAYTKENLFSKNNVKANVDIFIEANPKYQHFKYNSSTRKWKKNI